MLKAQSDERNKLVVLLDDYAAEAILDGGDSSQDIVLRPNDFTNYAGNALDDWTGVRRLKLSAAERLRPGRGQSGEPRVVGAVWKGAAPRFERLCWQVHPPGLDR